ncbi:MAG: site-2 protease family protein [Bryobacteraceae bacterium]
MTTICDCPQSDRAQWSFRLFGTPVRVKFWFWVALLILGSDRGPAGLLNWVAVCFVSILLHEMGHVLAFRFFRRDAEVVLYGFGGMAIPHRDVDGTFPEVMVAAAGPVAGLCLAGLTLAAAALTGGRVFLGRHMFLPYLSAMLNYKLLLWSHSVSLYSHATMLVNDLLFVNFYWGLVNLLPVWPLDGGHISRAFLEQWDRYDGRRKSLIASAVIAAAVALAGIANENTWLTIMFGLFAVSSLQAMEGARRRIIPSYRRWRD